MEVLFTSLSCLGLIVLTLFAGRKVTEEDFFMFPEEEEHDENSYS